MAEDRRTPGHDVVDVAVPSRVLPDEKGITCAAFLTSALDYFAGHGITRIEQLMTDNAWVYRYSLRDLCATAGISQIFIRPHCPWENGKVERLNRTLLTEWAYRSALRTDDERTAALAPWLQPDNTQRRRSPLAGLPTHQSASTNMMAGYTSRACTTPERLARWIARVEVCDAPHHLLLTTEPGTDDEGQIEAWLTEESGRTRLVVEERGLPTAHLPFHASGWRAHLEDVGRSLVVDGPVHPECWSSDAGAPRWRGRWEELTPTYQQMEIGWRRVRRAESPSPGEAPGRRVVDVWCLDEFRARAVIGSRPVRTGCPGRVARPLAGSCPYRRSTTWRTGRTS